MYESDYARARIAFSRSNKQEKIGALAEKTRYYLALTDFYAGDYEYAKIQLNSLERQNTSYFANDAVQLRMWIQKGLNADSTGSNIEPFAKGVEYFNQGEEQKALESFAPLISGDSYHTLMDEALLVMSRNISRSFTKVYYSAVTNYLDYWGQASALRERLMWEKARIADQIVSYDISIDGTEDTGIPPAPVQRFFEGDSEKVPLPTNQQEVQKLYENILLEFPNGFYASYARDRIQELKNPQT
ncbi:MAG: hypothetical protein U5K69_24360 [Balneolaceae bacterium]|nr:hypothetical protein [Balneolaceae bacterium]